MRLRIRHQTRYLYEEPARNILQILRLTPRSHEGQHVVRWRIEPSVEGHLTANTDAFGNVTHVFAPDEALREVTIGVHGEVETGDTSGIVREVIETLPDACYLRSTTLTEPDADIRAFAEKQIDRGGNTLSTLHRLMGAVHDRLAFDKDATAVATAATEAFKLGRGVCQDLSHVFLAGARHLRIPARYVSGFVLAPAGIAGHQAGHAWCEAKVPYLGWVAFDPTHMTCPTTAHVRVAIGLDYNDAAPVRGSRRGGGRESLDVDVRVEPVPGGQSQRQD